MARPKRTWLGGMFCKERARLIKSKTMITFVKEVIIIIKAGARESKLRSKIKKREKEASRGFCAALTPGMTGILIPLVRACAPHRHYRQKKYSAK